MLLTIRGWFSCVMNACVSPDYNSSQVLMWLCQIDLRKLHHRFGSRWVPDLRISALDSISLNDTKVYMSLWRSFNLKAKLIGSRKGFCTYKKMNKSLFFTDPRNNSFLKWSRFSYCVKLKSSSMNFTHLYFNLIV